MWAFRYTNYFFLSRVPVVHACRVSPAQLLATVLSHTHAALTTAKIQEDFFPFPKSHDMTSQISRPANSLSIPSDLKTGRAERDNWEKNVTSPLLLLLRRWRQRWGMSKSLRIKGPSVMIQFLSHCKLFRCSVSKGLKLTNKPSLSQRMSV